MTKELEKQIRDAFRRAGMIVIEEDLSQELRLLARNVADEIVLEGNNYLNENGVTDEGTLAGSAQVLEEEGQWVAAWLADHAEWINYGTEPHSINLEGVENIRGWVARKIKPEPDNSETRKEAVERVTNAIVWKIRKYGTDPQPFADVAVETVAERYRTQRL